MTGDLEQEKKGPDYDNNQKSLSADKKIYISSLFINDLDKTSKYLEARNHKS